MKKTILLFIGLLLLSGNAFAEPSDYSVSVGYGDAQPNIYICRLGLKKDFKSKWCSNNIGCLSGYFELSFNQWKWDKETIEAVGFSPVFVYYFGNEYSEYRPYIEGGIGVAYLDEYHIADRNLSSNFQFEDRLGFGLRNGNKDFNFRYMHYSNASTKQPNHGIDIFMLTTSISF